MISESPICTQVFYDLNWLGMVVHKSQHALRMVLGSQIVFGRHISHQTDRSLRLVFCRDSHVTRLRHKYSVDLYLLYSYRTFFYFFVWDETAYLFSQSRSDLEADSAIVMLFLH